MKGNHNSRGGQALPAPLLPAPGSNAQRGSGTTATHDTVVRLQAAAAQWQRNSGGDNDVQQR